MLLKLTFQVKKFFLSFFCYYNGNYYGFSIERNHSLTLVSLPERKPYQVLIVSRHFYTEKLSQYPIENRSELKKILALEFSDLERTKYHCWGYLNDQSSVNIWSFDERVPQAWLSIPESLLFAMNIKDKGVITLNTEKKLFVSVSNGSVISALQSPIINSVQRFMMSIGINPNQSANDCEERDIPNKLISGIKNLTIPLTLSFFPSIGKLIEIQRFKKVIIMALSIYLVNLSLTSLYLVYKENDLNSKLSANNKAVTTLLDEQNKSEELQNKYEVLTQFINTQVNHTPLLISLVKLYPKARLSNIRFKDNRYILRGYTKNALNLLTFMNQQTEIDDVKFDFPVNKGGVQEFFVISFKIIKDTPKATTSVAKLNNKQLMKASRYG